MFLFNSQRTGIQARKSPAKPEVVWKVFLRSNPAMPAESSPVFDAAGNIYFGCHNGNIYSLDPFGKIRWTFSTAKKLYGTLVIREGRIYASGGDGVFYVLDCDGNLLSLDKMYPAQKALPYLISFLAHLPFTIDVGMKLNRRIRSWASPNLIGERIVTMAYGKGLYCYNLDGKRLWTVDLGFPRFQLSGVAISEDGRIFCVSRRGRAYCVNLDGEIVWQKKLRTLWENWGTPSVNQAKGLVNFTQSSRENSGELRALDFSGKEAWKLRLGPLRGGVCISKDGGSLYVCDLNGLIYKIGQLDGVIVAKKKLTDARRGLWTTPTVDDHGDILLSTKDSFEEGRILKLDENLELIWEFLTMKCLSIPTVGPDNRLYFGVHGGHYYCIGDG